jgi:hypothetical protein
MSIRQTLNEKPAVAYSVAGVVCLLAVALFFFEHGGSGGSGGEDREGKVFFSDDDGQSWFLDGRGQIPPFDHNGKQACKAGVYRCAAGIPYLAYLEKYSDNELARVAKEHQDFDAYQAAHPMPNGSPPFYPSISPTLAKKPGDANWIPATLPGGKDNPAYKNLTHPLCPDGSNAIVVGPTDPDALR